MPGLYVQAQLQACSGDEQMKYAPLIIVVSFFCIVGYFGSSIVGFFTVTQPRYDCQLAEISPDVPLKVKQECRELRIKNGQKNIQGDSVTIGR
jgi:membrane glycosyltransferase